MKTNWAPPKLEMCGDWDCPSRRYCFRSTDSGTEPRAKQPWFPHGCGGRSSSAPNCVWFVQAPHAPVLPCTLHYANVF
jgi:hypothetical protein